MKKFVALSAFVLMLASISGCTAMRPMPQEYTYGQGVRDVAVMNPNSYAKSMADAIDRACNLTRLQYKKVFKAYWHEMQEINRHITSDPNYMRLDRSYLREHGRLERKMRRILDSQQFARWRRIEARNRR